MRRDPRDRVLRALAVLHLVGASGIALFWLGFFTEVSFPRSELAPKIPHFEAYLAFERAFVIPDLATAAAMTLAACLLLADRGATFGRTLLGAASGALVFLALLDTAYDASNGMYTLGAFSLELMAVPLVGVLGATTVGYLARQDATVRSIQGAAASTRP